MPKRKKVYCHKVNSFRLPRFFYIFLLMLFSLSVYIATARIPTIPTTFLLSAISRSVLPFHISEKTSVRFTTYDLIEHSILAIKASDVMNKKYAAKYGGIRKTDKITVPKTEPLVESVTETDASVSDIRFINTPGVEVNAVNLLNLPLEFYPQDGAPRILIVHTHTSEAYSNSDNSRSENPDLNVVSVGKAIKDSLEKAGIGVIHDTTQNDNPSYNQSYKKALNVIENNLSKHPTLEIVLDIHRDYIKQDDGTLAKPTTTLPDGQKAAQIMFVMGTDSMGLYHPNWRHNLAFSVQIQSYLQKNVPGLCRAINIRTERFNQHATKGSMIIEVGTGANTLDEAQLSGKLIGDAIATVLK